MSESGRSPAEAADDDVIAGCTRGFGFAALVLAAGFVLGWIAQLGVPGLGAFSVLWPQRWRFFTGLERDSVVAYQVTEPGRPFSLLDDVGHHGLGRDGETRFSEAWRFALRVPDAHWQACTRQDALACGLDLTTGNTAYRMKNSSPGRLLCGHLALSVERTDLPPVGQLPDQPRRVHRIALVDIECR